MRAVGICMMAGAVTGAGFWAAERVKDRMELLQLIRKMIYHLKNRILYANATLPEAVWEVGHLFAEGRSGIWKEPGLFFCRVSDVLEKERNLSFGEAWNRSMDEISCDVPLHISDRGNLMSLGNSLGCSDREMQERTLLFYLEQTDDTIAGLKKEVEIRGKLYRSLGIAGGLFLVILLI